MRMKILVGIMVANWLNGGVYHGLFGWVQYNHKGPQKWKREAEEEVRVIQYEKTRLTISGLENGGSGAHKARFAGRL